MIDAELEARILKRTARLCRREMANAPVVLPKLCARPSRRQASDRLGPQMFWIVQESICPLKEAFRFYTIPSMISAAGRTSPISPAASPMNSPAQSVSPSRNPAQKRSLSTALTSGSNSAASRPCHRAVKPLLSARPLKSLGPVVASHHIHHVGLHRGITVSCDDCIWDKTRLVIRRGDYHWQHEPAIYAVRKGKTGHWAGGRNQTTVWAIPPDLGTHAIRSCAAEGTRRPARQPEQRRRGRRTRAARFRSNEAEAFAANVLPISSHCEPQGCGTCAGWLRRSNNPGVPHRSWRPVARLQRQELD